MTINGIRRNRAMDKGQVHPDLMCPSSQGMDFQQSMLLKSLTSEILTDRLPAFVRLGYPHQLTVGGISPNMGLNATFGCGWLAIH